MVNRLLRDRVPLANIRIVKVQIMHMHWVMTLSLRSCFFKSSAVSAVSIQMARHLEKKRPDFTIMHLYKEFYARRRKNS